MTNRHPQARLVITLLTVLASANVLAGEESTVDGVVHIRNDATPRDGIQTLQLQELWRAGGEDDYETIFGVIAQVLTDGDGNIYLLDQQLSEVQVYSPEGEYVKTLSREGDGPGEVRYPRDMLFLPDGTLGIVQPMPGTIVKVHLDGAPANSIILSDPMEGGRHALYSAQSRNGHLIVCANDMSKGKKSMRRTRYLSSIDEDGGEQVRYLEQNIERELRGFQWNEEDEYFVHFGRSALGTDGRVYAAPYRDSYTIQIYHPDGTLERVVEREFSPRKRAQEDKERILSTRKVRFRGKGRGKEIQQELSDYDPCISKLHADGDDGLWVLHSRSGREQPDGIFQTYDIFDSDGHFVRQVAVACPGDPREDGFFMLEDGKRAIVVRGLVDARAALVGSSGREESEDDGDAAPLEIICYRVVEIAGG
jgi:hypothetical protein